MFQAAADAADACDWAMDAIQGAMAFVKLHKEAKGIPQKLKVEELRALLTHHLHFETTSNNKATLLAELVPFHEALGISSAPGEKRRQQPRL